MLEFEDVAQVIDVPPGAYLEFEVAGKEIIVANLDSNFYAFAAICTHMDGPLVQGALAGGVITCPWHFSEFRVADGAVLKGPAADPLATYPVKVEGGRILVSVAESGSSGG